MFRKIVWRITFFAGPVIAICLLIALFLRARRQLEARDITGVVLIDDSDTKKQRPIADVHVGVPGYSSVLTDASGLFHIRLSPGALLNPVTLTFQHPDYPMAQRTVSADRELYVVRMKPTNTVPIADGPKTTVSDVRVRYTESERTSPDTGSALKSFEVVNAANIACNDRPPCSPDGRWKAAIGGASLDAGVGNEFREARLSCIAGPCPFTKVERDGFSKGGRTIDVTIRDWSDTVSFVLEAEVTRTSIADMIRTSYPIIFGTGMNFTLPPTGEGASIEATVGGMEIVYPLGPGLDLSWTKCTLQMAQDQAKSYRCDLKPGYQFRSESEARPN
jgi:hypothetical protein